MPSRSGSATSRSRWHDPRWLAPLVMQAQSGSAFLRVDMYQAALANCFAMSRYIRSGYAAPPGYSVVAHSLYPLVMTGDTERTQRLLQSAARLNELIPDPVYTPRSENVATFAIHPWLMRRRRAIAPAQRIAEALREVGDREYEVYAHFLELAYLALAGDPVAEVERRMDQLAEAVKRSGILYPEPEVVNKAYRLLLFFDPHTLDRQLAESDAWIDAHPSSAEAYVRTCWLMVLCIFERHDLAFAQSEALGERLFRIAPLVHVADHTFYRGIAAAALAEGAPRHRATRHRRVLHHSLRLLQRWARNGPNFVHMALLLEAERARLRGRHGVARLAYERAAEQARQQQFPHHAALAHERRAGMLGELRRETEASAALESAAGLYHEWGAAAKVAQIAQRLRETAS